MRVNVLRLLREPIGTQASTEFDLGFQLLSDDTKVNSVKGPLQLFRTDEGVLVKGTLFISVDLECGRCLSNTASTIQVELDEHFRMPTPKLLEDPQALLIDAHHLLDLRPVLRDLVIVYTPMHVLCQPGCLGLCPSCGKDLNEGPCDCEVDDIDPRLIVLKALIE